MSIDEDIRKAVESHLDAVGLAHYLGLVADVCESKREHVLSNWQDAGLSEEWEKARVRIAKLVNEVNI